MPAAIRIKESVRIIGSSPCPQYFQGSRKDFRVLLDIDEFCFTESHGDLYDRRVYQTYPVDEYGYAFFVDEDYTYHGHDQIDDTV